jgi:oligosaccharyltransferase complex subunit beta
MGADLLALNSSAETVMVDHTSYDLSDPHHDHSLLVASDFLNSSHVTDAAQRPVLFRGLGQTVNPDNFLAVPILRAPASSYSAKQDEIITNAHASGDNLLLVTGVQARNNARIAFAGSMYMFSDEAMDAEVQIPVWNSAQVSGNR